MLPFGHRNAGDGRKGAPVDAPLRRTRAESPWTQAYKTGESGNGLDDQRRLHQLRRVRSGVSERGNHRRRRRFRHRCRQVHGMCRLLRLTAVHRRLSGRCHRATGGCVAPLPALPGPGGQPWAGESDKTGYKQKAR
ncbi:hypothetical protein ebA5388 [Aromatoleum aromaticum EbN1]|uniref:Uncharacterized protein n=1 Tax=Aromatoleum aromaticum (strain DSM 19018 / LMG 30748 / EbN1) TaxID=76114 RepID=Q5P0I3_AROAE|nr:hypothetical protein ebA5388 [Aromatoleum aromaticum EbN1]